MHSIVIDVSVRAPRDCGLWYRYFHQIFLFLGYLFRWGGGSLSFEFIANIIFLYIEGILFHPTFVFAETYWASALLTLIMLSHVYNRIAIWCSISLVCF